jgi:ribosomal 30S subunit maturation factor RimM
MIPLVDEFIIKVDSNGKKIYIKNMKGLILWKLIY